MSVSVFPVSSFLIVLLMMLMIVAMCFQGLLCAVNAVSNGYSCGLLLVWSICLGRIRSVMGTANAPAAACCGCLYPSPPSLEGLLR